MIKKRNRRKILQYDIAIVCDSFHALNGVNFGTYGWFAIFQKWQQLNAFQERHGLLRLCNEFTRNARKNTENNPKHWSILHLFDLLFRSSTEVLLSVAKLECDFRSMASSPLLTVRLKSSLCCFWDAQNNLQCITQPTQSKDCSIVNTQQILARRSNSGTCALQR